MDRTQDRALIAGLQAGSHESLRQVADLYGPRVFQLAMRHVKNREDAEEITQDVLMKVYRKAGSFRGDAALSSWIYRITFNTSMSRLRQRHSARAAERRDSARIDGWDEPVKVPSEPADWSHMPDEELLRLELRKAITAAISDLPEIYRGPIILRDLEGLTTQEASTRLKVKDETLKSRLHRGRLLLRERLQSVFGLKSPVGLRSPVFGLR
jgi:RNA polymerase sigma-70 factor (ECF subfamily)